MPTVSKTPMPPNVPDITAARSIDARRGLRWRVGRHENRAGAARTSAPTLSQANDHGGPAAA
jgi:hypothetical protein